MNISFEFIPLFSESSLMISRFSLVSELLGSSCRNWSESRGLDLRARRTWMRRIHYLQVSLCENKQWQASCKIASHVVVVNHTCKPCIVGVYSNRKGFCFKGKNQFESDWLFRSVTSSFPWRRLCQINRDRLRTSGVLCLPNSLSKCRSGYVFMTVCDSCKGSILSKPTPF